MNPHPKGTGEHLAHECLAQAGGDWSVAVDLIRSSARGVLRVHALRALALWATFSPVANDNDPEENQ